tara:strand:+ start:378 stop:602 length:225 start_codon:yes stop_codon:yes gene_type:complete
MPIDKTTLEQTLRSAFEDGTVECIDLAGDDDHWQVVICSKKFKGMTPINQHRMVQQSLQGHDIHALSIKTSIME